MRGDQRSDKPLAGEVALVTGGSRGIGLAIVRRLLEAGAAVTLVARDRAGLDQASGSLPVHEGTVLPLIGDVTDPHSMELTVEQMVERLGSLSILVNNAGVGLYGPTGRSVRSPAPPRPQRASAIARPSGESASTGIWRSSMVKPSISSSASKGWSTRQAEARHDEAPAVAID